jgi:alpha-1,3-rhamnosyl/mannosyltransferase
MTMGCSSLMLHPTFYPPLIRMRLRFLLHRAIPQAARIMCPSQHVLDVTQDRFRLPADRLSIVSPGVDSAFRPMDESEVRAVTEERYGLRYPYFLFSGRWEHRKNIIRTLEAFALFKRTTPSEHKLVLTGDTSWIEEEVAERISRLGIHDSITNLGNTPWTDLPYLYCGATALLYASLWEGFGLPIVESMACGTPVITSNVSAMPETAGGAGLIVDPNSTEEIADAMHRLASDENLRGVLREKGLKRAAFFTWDEAARRTLSLYTDVATASSY